MEGAVGSGGPKIINRKVLRNAYKLFDILHDATIPVEDKLPLMTEVLSGEEVDVNFPDEHFGYDTLLHGAVTHGFIDIVKLLLEYKADVNLKNAEGETPLHKAVCHGFIDIVKLLLDKKAVVDSKNAKKESPLHLIVSGTRIDNNNVKKSIIKMLIEHKADVNIQNSAGDTLLHLAVRKEVIPVIGALARITDVDADIKNSAGETPRGLHEKKNNNEINKIFIKSFKKHDPVLLDTIPPHQDNNASVVNERSVKDAEQVEQVADAFANFPDKYKVSGAKESIHGTVYQLDLLKLFALRALKLGYPFRLGTEVKEAEQFDDIVLKYTLPESDEIKTMFIQAKHRAKTVKKLNYDDLLPKDTKDEFSLLKYFKSFVKIMHSRGEEVSKPDFVICTNAHFASGEKVKLVKGNMILPLTKVPEENPGFYPEFFKEGKCYRLDTEAKSVEFLKSEFEPKLTSELRKEQNSVKQELDTIRNKEASDTKKESKKKEKYLEDILSSLKDGESLKTFLTQLVFVVANEMNNKLVTSEIESHITNKNLDPDVFADAFHNKIYNWFSNKEGEWLNKETVKEMIDSLTRPIDRMESWYLSLTREYAEKLLNSPLKFNEDKLVELKILVTKHSIVNIATPMEFKLTLIRVAQAIEYSGSNEAQSTEPSRSNEAQTTEPSGSNEAQTTEPSGSNEDQTTEPSGFNEAQNIKTPFFLNEAQSTEPSGSNEAQTREFSGSDEAQTIKQSVSSEAQSTEPSVSNETQTIKPSEFNEAQHTETSGYNEAQFTEPSGSIEAQTKKTSVSNEALDSCMFMRLSSLLQRDAQDVIVETFKSSVKNNLLVIDCLSKKTDFKEEAVNTLFKKLSVITTNNPKKKLVIIAAENNDELHGMLKPCLGYYKHTVKNTWKDLTNDTQDNLLQEKVKFQGKLVKVKQIIDKTEKELLEIVPLETLIGDEGLVIGTELPTHIGYNEHIYIKRSVNAVNQIVLKADIIEDKSKGKFKEELASTEAEFQDLCKKHPKANIHLIEKQGDKYIWVKSRGEFTALRPYIENINYQLCSEEDFLNSVEQQPVVIISDLAGMGKSTVLTHFSEQIKSNTEGTLVFRIDLNNYTKLWENHKTKIFDNSSALEFLCNEIIKIKTPLESALFKRKGKVVLLFDGFDEISPDYKETVLGLIQNLTEATEAQIWITTRPFMKEILEDKLCQLSSSLEPLSKKDQVDYLTKYWKHMSLRVDTSRDVMHRQPRLVNNIKDSEEEDTQKFASLIISQFSKSISDKEREFMAIPLQMKMLAECFVDDFEKPIDPERFNLVNLYKQFIKKKFDIYHLEKYETDSSKVGSKHNQKLIFAACITQHRYLALSVILSKDKFALLIPKDKAVIDSDEKIMINKIGIVNLSNGTPHFIHRTFAEYWVAEYFMEQLQDPACMKSIVKSFILSELLISDNYAVVRSFLNGHPAICKLSEIKNPLLTNEDINNKNEIIRNIFVRTAIERNNNIFKYILNGVEGKDERVIQLLQGNSPNERLLNLAAKNNNSQFIGSLLQYTRANTDQDREIVKQMLEARDSDGRTSLIIASERGLSDVVQSLLKWTRENLTEDQEIVKQMLLAGDNIGWTPLHHAALGGNNAVVQTLLQYTRYNLTEGQDVMKRMLEAVDIEDWTPLHHAALGRNNAVVQTLLQYTRDHLTEYHVLVKRMLGAIENERRTPLHHAALRGKNDVVQTLLQFTLDCLDEETLRELLLLRDCKDKPALSYQHGGLNHPVCDKIMEWAEGDNNINIQEYITALYKSDL